jgi:predicted aspartyl protease
MLAPMTLGGWLSRGLALGLLLSAVGAPSADAACKIAQITELHVDRVGNLPFVDGQINGQPVRILLDTGAADSFMSGGAARRLKLALRDSNISYRGVNGETRMQLAVVDHLKIGAFSADDLLFHVTGPKVGEQPDEIGFVLGANFFWHFTTEFDLAHGVIRLLQPIDCKPEQLVYWDQSYFLANIESMTSDDPWIITRVTVNGTRLRALLDSGAATSFISTIAARQAGVTTDSPGVVPSTPVHGLATQPLPTWIGRFDSFSVGNETIRNARIRMGDLFGADRDPKLGTRIAQSDDRLPDMILGEDFLQSHRVVVLPREHAALFTYNGGTVFQLVRPNERNPQ